LSLVISRETELTHSDMHEEFLAQTEPLSDDDGPPVTLHFASVPEIFIHWPVPDRI